MKAIFNRIQDLADFSHILKDSLLPFRIIIGLKILGFLLSATTTFYELFSLLPFQLFSIEVWRVITSAFVGKNVFMLIWTIWSFHFGTTLVQQSNSNDVLLKLYTLTQILTTVLICAAAFILYAIFGYTFLLYKVNVVDMVPINCAVLVLVKQFLPDSIILATPVGSIKYNYLPFFTVIISLFSSIIGLTNYVVVLQCILSVQLSWTYLRFFNPNETNTIFGDDSEHFTWASLFPYRMQSMCTIVGRISFRGLNKLGILRRQVHHMDSNSLQSVTITLPALESTNKDAERRRQKALHDLNERLIRAKKIGGMVWEDDMNDENFDDSQESAPTEDTAINQSQKSDSVA